MRYLLLLSLMSISQGLTAQVPRNPRLADSSAAVILTHIGSRVSDTRLAISVLRNDSDKYTRGKQDAVADALAALAINNRANGNTSADTAGYYAAARAVDALGRAGMERYAGIDSASPGRPYDGSLDRLIHISKDAPVRLVRSRALRLILRLQDRPHALSYVESVAESPDDRAWDAVVRLIEDASGQTETPKPTTTQRQESMAILRDLATNHRVPNRIAAQTLNEWLSAQPRSSGRGTS